MEKANLVVSIDARFDWLKPAESEHEKHMREQADVLAKAVADRLNVAVRLLVAEFLTQTKI